MTELTLLGISGSLRQNSANSQLLREAARMFGEARFIEADLNIPLYDGDDEAVTGVPEAAQRLSDQIASADAILVSTPEYNKGPSGVLKNALDWVSRTPARPWTDKPVAVMSGAAGRSGGERAQTILRAFLLPFRPRMLAGPEFHLADCTNGFDENGRLIGDMYINTLQELMTTLRQESLR